MEELCDLLHDYSTNETYQQHILELNQSWNNYVEKVYNDHDHETLTQAEVIGAVNNIAIPDDVVVCAAGSLPGDLHKLWKATHQKAFHLEYGYSTMGYECAAGIGAKLASPDREIWVMVGDGNYLMMNTEIVTAIQEGVKFNIVLINNNGFGSIGALSQSLGFQRFGTKYRYRDENTGQLTGDLLPVDYAMNAKSLGADVIKVNNIDSLQAALSQAKNNTKTTVIVVETDLYKGIPGYAWWEVPIAEVSEIDTVKKAYKNYIEKKKKQRYYL